MKDCLNHWEEITARIQASPGIFVAFDYDGVLSPIAARPEWARMPAENHRLLECLASQPKTHVAVVSGRALADVRQQVDLPGLLYAGNHGAEIAISGKTEQHIVLEQYRQTLVDVQRQLLPWTQRFPGLRLEDKGFGIGLHYREVAADQIPILLNAFTLWAKDLPEELAVFTAKRMLEVRPKVEWNKGNAVLRLWGAVAPLSLPFCLGDDRTDEDGFMALKGKGINIFVGTAKESCAEYFLESTDDVTIFLQRLLNAAKETFPSQ